MSDYLHRELADARRCLAYGIRNDLPMEWVEYWRQRVVDLGGAEPTTTIQEEQHMKTIAAYEIIYHGVDWADYFPGCGLAHTEYADVATGIGNSDREALEDALDQLAQNGWDTDSNAELSAELLTASDVDQVQEAIDEYREDDGDDDDGETPLVHVSVRVR